MSPCRPVSVSVSPIAVSLRQCIPMSLHLHVTVSLCHRVPTSPCHLIPTPPSHPWPSMSLFPLCPHICHLFLSPSMLCAPHPLPHPHVSLWCHLHTCPRVPAAGPWRNNTVMWRCCRDGATALPIRATCQQRGQRVTTAGGCRDAFLQCCEVAQNLRRKGQHGGLARGECQQCPQSGEG